MEGLIYWRYVGEQNCQTVKLWVNKKNCKAHERKRKILRQYLSLTGLTVFIHFRSYQV